MNSSSDTESAQAPLALHKSARDFSTNYRLLIISVMAVIVGVFGAIGAWVLQRLISLVTNLAYYGRFSADNVPIGDHALGWLSVLIPVAGCLVIGLMARFGSEKIRGHGIPEAIEAILIGKSRIQPKVAILKPLSSAISIGTGGPFGAEGPIIMTGGAFGSIFAQMFKLSSAERKTLLVAGAAAGMSATFNSPVAAMLLAVELLLFEWKPRSFVPVSIASMVAAVLRPYLLGPGILFPIPPIPEIPPLALLFCAVLGIASGLLSGLLTQMVYKFEELFQAMPLHWMWWPAIGGVVIGLGGLVDPHVLGVGYDNIAALLAGHETDHDALLLLVVKALVWSVALGSGTSGGVLAPLLMMGGALGDVVAPYIPYGNASFWSLIAMAAVMSGTMRSPLTAVVFALELTHGIDALLPLAAACVVAQGTTVLLLKRSILTEKVARRGCHVFREYVVDPFELVRVAEIMTKSVETLSENMTVAEAVAFFSAGDPGTHHQYYPVVDATGKPIGVVSRAETLQWALCGAAPGETLGSRLGHTRMVVGRAYEFAGRLTERMMQADADCALILNEQRGTLVGMVTRADLLQARSGIIVQELTREALIPMRHVG
jgi:H+/Cl- antiporter ClcA